MTPKPFWKLVLEISTKHAVNAILTNGALMTLLGNWHQLSTKEGWVNVLYLTISTVAAREGLVWLPKLLKWSQSTGGDDWNQFH